MAVRYRMCTINARWSSNSSARGWQARPRKSCTALTEAVAGDIEALADIVELYMTLIDYYSCVDGKLDEDLRHSILLHLLEKIPKFEIWEKFFDRTIRFSHFKMSLLYEGISPCPLCLDNFTVWPGTYPCGRAAIHQRWSRVDMRRRPNATPLQKIWENRPLRNLLATDAGEDFFGCKILVCGV